MKKTTALLLVIGIFLFLGSVLFGTYISIPDKVIYKEMPCVDGDGDKNLEGIMCNKRVEEYKLNPIFIIFSLFGIILGVCIMVGGFNNLIEERNGK